MTTTCLKYDQILAIAIISLIASACVSTSVTKLDTKYEYRPTTADRVDLYLEPEDIPCEFERIALINTETGFELDNTRSIKAAKEEAAWMGGNGIILRGYQYPEDEGESSKVGTMVAIHIHQDKCY